MWVENFTIFPISTWRSTDFCIAPKHQRLMDWNIKEGTRTIAQYPDINAASKKNV